MFQVWNTISLHKVIGVRYMQFELLVGVGQTSIHASAVELSPTTALMVFFSTDKYTLKKTS